MAGRRVDTASQCVLVTPISSADRWDPLLHSVLA